jgi:hypothetical protein
MLALVIGLLSQAMTEFVTLANGRVLIFVSAAAFFGPPRLDAPAARPGLFFVWMR